MLIQLIEEIISLISAIHSQKQLIIYLMNMFYMTFIRHMIHKLHPKKS